MAVDAGKPGPSSLGDKKPRVVPRKRPSPTNKSTWWNLGAHIVYQVAIFSAFLVPLCIASHYAMKGREVVTTRTHDFDTIDACFAPYSAPPGAPAEAEELIPAVFSATDEMSEMLQEKQLLYKTSSGLLQTITSLGLKVEDLDPDLQQLLATVPVLQMADERRQNALLTASGMEDEVPASAGKSPAVQAITPADLAKIQQCLKMTGVQGKRSPLTWILDVTYGIADAQSVSNDLVLVSGFQWLGTDTMVKLQRTLAGDWLRYEVVALTAVYLVGMMALSWGGWKVLEALGSAATVFNFIQFVYSLHGAAINLVEGVCAGVQLRARWWAGMGLAALLTLIEMGAIFIGAGVFHIKGTIVINVCTIINIQVATGGKGCQWAYQHVRQRLERIVPLCADMVPVGFPLPFFFEPAEARPGTGPADLEANKTE